VVAVAQGELIEIQDHDDWARNQAYKDEALSPIFNLLEAVKDPEIPALSIWDMGILRAIERREENGEELIAVIITLTYSGCPAMDLITEDIHQILNDAGYKQVKVEIRLAPAWTTRWMSDDAQQRMAASGIAPPDSGKNGKSPQCPICSSSNTRLISQFSSTACKAMYRCESCLEPFDYFKHF
jgi:ring-1,2-phenylacetyl-CoA epoxidase subunit PaaD